MNVILNGECIILKDGITVDRLLLDRNLEIDKVVVEHNLEIVKSVDWASTVIKENDSLEVLRFVGGG